MHEIYTELAQDGGGIDGMIERSVKRAQHEEEAVEEDFIEGLDQDPTMEHAVQAAEEKARVRRHSTSFTGKGNVEAGNEMLEILEQPKRKKRKGHEAVKKGALVVPVTCGCLPIGSGVRSFAFRLVRHQVFEGIITVVIILSSGMMALDNTWQPDDTVKDLMAVVDPIFLAIFTLEMTLKLMALGLYGAPTAYLSDSWNFLDMFCVLISWFTLLMSVIGVGSGGGVGRILRTLRTLRPLRMINKNERIQIVFNALYRSLPAVFNVALLTCFFMFLFGVLGMSFFAGDSAPTPHA